MSKKTICDGWHEVPGGAVYTEDGIIKRATRRTVRGEDLSAAVYREAPGGGCDNVMPCSYLSFRRGLRRGRWYIL